MYKEKTQDIPCEQCGKLRKFRLIKHNGLYKNYRPLCAICGKRGRKYETKNYFNKIDTEEKAYSFGFFWADGCINRYKTFTVRLHIQDADILDFFKDYFGGIRSKRQFKRSDGRLYYQEEWVINDVNWINYLKQIGFRETLDKIPDHLFNHFLRGLLDGDGYYSYRKNGDLTNISISSNYEDDFEWLVNKIKIPFRISKIKGKTKCSVIYFKGGKLKLDAFVKDIYLNSTIYLNRKYNYNKHKF